MTTDETTSGTERPKDHLDEVFERYGRPGKCEYCGKQAKVRSEPFGDRDACKTCWDDIIGGE
jgi:hypothetical protein